MPAPKEKSPRTPAEFNEHSEAPAPRSSRPAGAAGSGTPRGDAGRAAPEQFPEYAVHSHIVSSGGTATAPGGQTVRLPEMRANLPLHKRPAEAMRMAQDAFAQTGYWIVFYRTILGPSGIIQQLFPSQGEMEYFESTREFEEIHQMLTALRSSDVEKAESIEPQKMITLRIPRSLNAALVEEAKRHSVSINKLCISKLLLPAAPEFVPTERGKVRGRKPKR